MYVVSLGHADKPNFNLSKVVYFRQTVRFPILQLEFCL